VRRSSGRRAFDRSVERSAVASLVPVLALVPVWLVALAVFWFPIHLVWHIPFWLFALLHLGLVVLMFWRPLQAVLVMRMLGAKRATPEQAQLLEPAWRSVAQQLGIRPQRYALAVLPSDELNAFACGGSLLVVTSYAIDTLPRDEMTGVLAHELAHHLGFHTVALTLRQWLSMPIYLLAKVGFFLQNVATAATRSYVSHSSALSAVGRLVSGILNVIAWAFLSALLVSNRIANRVGRRSEFEADRRAVAMGFGRELSTALRRVEATEPPRDDSTLRGNLVVTHPSARSRVMRIDAFRRQRTSRERMQRGAY
jgi:Zn-dependent protease with chaperone function